jgi:hypothetical protein
VCSDLRCEGAGAGLVDVGATGIHIESAHARTVNCRADRPSPDSCADELRPDSASNVRADARADGRAHDSRRHGSSARLLPYLYDR